MGSLRFSVATTTGTASALACAGAAAAHRSDDFEIAVLPAYQHFRPSIRRQDQGPRAFDGGATLHSLICAFACTVGMPIGARAAMQAAKTTSRICVFIEHPCGSIGCGMPDLLLNLVTRGRKSDHIPGERRRDRLRRGRSYSSLRAQASCPPRHAGAKLQTIHAEQIGIDISRVGFGRKPEIKWPAALSLPTSSNCPAPNGALASTDSNGDIASSSAAEPDVGRLYCKCTPQK